MEESRIKEREGEKRGEGKRRRRGKNGRKGGEAVLGDADSGNLNPGRRRGGKVDRRSVGDENKVEEDRGIGGDEEEGERGENERRGGGVVFLAMQVLQISAGGRGSPLVF